jgi:hypothetical protein
MPFYVLNSAEIFYQDLYNIFLRLEEMTRRVEGTDKGAKFRYI